MNRVDKRIIETALPINEISMLRSKRSVSGDMDVRKLGLWWSRKPQHQCRGILIATLLPDPTDSNADPALLDRLRSFLASSGLLSTRAMQDKEAFREDLLKLCVYLAQPSQVTNVYGKSLLDGLSKLLRLGDKVCLDPFSGGGAIPIEAQRLGMSSIAGEYNPFAILMLRAAMEVAPAVSINVLRKTTDCIAEVVKNVKEKLCRFYKPHHRYGTPIGYINFRQLVCEGPGCGQVIPATSKFIFDARAKTGAIFTSNEEKKHLQLSLVTNHTGQFPEPTMRQGSITCPVCGYVTSRKSVNTQLDRFNLPPRIVAGVYEDSGKKIFKELNQEQKSAFIEFDRWCLEHQDWKKYVPWEEWPDTEPRRFSPPLYGYRDFASCHTTRQLTFLGAFLSSYHSVLKTTSGIEKVADILMALVVSRLVDLNTSFCRWRNDRGGAFENTFSRSGGIGMMWDFFEANPFHEIHRLEQQPGLIRDCLIAFSALSSMNGTVIEGPAQNIPLPDDSVDILYTDPPYFDSIPYSHLSDWINVWIARVSTPPDSIKRIGGALTNKELEIVVDRPHSLSPSTHDSSHFQRELTKALTKSRVVLKPDGIAIIVFAHTSTSAWESLIESVLTAGYLITASWPIRTERGGRIQTQNKASLESSIHLVCRPRENPDGSLRMDDVGDWRDVLTELPDRIHRWMPRLADEGVIGADAIFACLGPALEIYSRYASVEKASGEKVSLSEYLEEVWAAVSREALNMIFEGADASGFEEDARLTAMWLWTLRTTVNNGDGEDGEQTKSLPGYNLEYDAARKIAQSLGVHLENLAHLVEINGDIAMLLSAGARTHYLFGKDAAETPKGKRKKVMHQKSLFDFEEDTNQIEEKWIDWPGELRGKAGSTILDQLHQSMILFSAGRVEALKSFLIEEGVGRNPLFWRLAQALSALYPAGTDEKRWADGVLARKKGLGL